MAKRAFIFSLDAFVAFTLILVVLHALIFLAAVPSSYYSGLMQAHYLASDTLHALAVANASSVAATQQTASNLDLSLLDYIVRNRGDPGTVRQLVGSVIPNQYGYRLEFWNATSGSDYGVWNLIYDTKDYPNDPGEPHNKEYNKLQASASAIYFGYLDDRTGYDNHHCYITCNPSKYGAPDCDTPCVDYPPFYYADGNATLGLVRLTVYR